MYIYIYVYIFLTLAEESLLASLLFNLACWAAYSNGLCLYLLRVNLKPQSLLDNLAFSCVENVACQVESYDVP